MHVAIDLRHKVEVIEVTRQQPSFLSYLFICVKNQNVLFKAPVALNWAKGPMYPLRVCFMFCRFQLYLLDLSHSYTRCPSGKA